MVVILGLLSAVAIPAFSRSVHQSRQAEAMLMLDRLKTGATTYFLNDRTSAPGQASPQQFPGPGSATLEQASQCGCLTGARCPGGSAVWSSDGLWAALGFSLPDPHSYRPSYSGAGQGVASTFTASLTGDLDCDGNLGHYELDGEIGADGEILTFRSIMNGAE